MTTTAMPYTHLGAALATDYLIVREQFSDAEWERFLATRRFVDEEVLPVINDFWERAEPPWPLLTRLAELGVVGEDIEGLGARGCRRWPPAWCRWSCTAATAASARSSACSPVWR